MSVKIQVTDSSNNPVQGVQVIVNWGYTTSDRRTNSSGIADLECSAGTAKRISIDGTVIHEGDYSLKDGVNSFRHPRK